MKFSKEYITYYWNRAEKIEPNPICEQLQVWRQINITFSNKAFMKFGISYWNETMNRLGLYESAFQK